VGHQSIGTTAIYDREQLSQKDIIKVLHDLDESRIKHKLMEKQNELEEKLVGLLPPPLRSKEKANKKIY
jgi:hypothetical protein